MRKFSYIVLLLGALVVLYSLLFMNSFTDGFIDFEAIGLSGIPNLEKEVLCDIVGFGLLILGTFLFVCSGVPLRCPFCNHVLHKTHGHCPNCARNIFISPHAKSGTIHPEIPAYYWEPENYFYRLHGETFLNANQVEALNMRIITANPHLHPVSALDSFHNEIFNLHCRLPSFHQAEFRQRMTEFRKKQIADQK